MEAGKMVRLIKTLTMWRLEVTLQKGVIMKFDNEEDLSDYVVATAHQAYLAETTEQTLGEQSV